MKKKILALLLSIVILMSFASCLPEKDPNVTSGIETTDTTPLSATLELILNGNAQCAVVRPDNANNDSATVKAAVNILNEINKIASTNTASIKTDYKKGDQVYNSETIEILVGLTGYNETKTVMNTLGYGDYIVKVEGNKIIVSGWMEGAVTRAADNFISKIKEAADDNKTVIFQRSDLLTGTFNSIVNEIPLFEGGILTATYDCGNGATMAILKDGSVDNFNQYTDKVAAAGFTFYTKNILGDNVYSSFTTDKYLLNVLYTKYDNNVRIIIEPLSATALTGKESENTFTKIKDSQITMAGLEYGATTNAEGSVSYQNGICLIIRLEDNSFIVYDGGFNRSHDSSQILNILREQSGVSKPVIAAWIFSHEHGDHTGAFVHFSKNYASMVTVERFILNRPATGVGSASTEGSSWATIKEAMDKFPGAKITKAHPGQVFYIRNAVVKILYTLELFAPKDLTYFNTSSLLCSVEISGFKMMITGDLSEDGSRIVSRAYGDYLQSNLMTVAHHGYQGGTTQLHTYIKPDYVLWPMGENHYFKYKDAERSAYFFAPNTSVKKIFVAKAIIQTFPLPYTGTGETIKQ